MTLWHVNEYHNSRGRSLGVLLAASPNLAIELIPAEKRRPRATWATDAYCDHCDRAIGWAGIGGSRRLLRCACLTVYHDEAAIPRAMLLPLWDELRAVKTRAELQLAPVEGN
jgi:hypothetical protein